MKLPEATTDSRTELIYATATSQSMIYSVIKHKKQTVKICSSKKKKKLFETFLCITECN